jgi:hypothetical protein
LLHALAPKVETVLRENSSEAATYFFALGYVLLDSGAIEAAIAPLQQAEAARCAATSVDQHPCAETRTVLAAALQAQGRDVEATSFAAASASLLATPRSSPDLRRVAQQIADRLAPGMRGQ